MGATAGAITLGDILTGAAVGGGVSAVTGGDPLTGALTGGIGGAASPFIGDAISGLGGAAGTSIPIDFASAAAPGIDLATGLAAGAPGIALAPVEAAATGGLIGGGVTDLGGYLGKVAYGTPGASASDLAFGTTGLPGAAAPPIGALPGGTTPVGASAEQLPIQTGTAPTPTPTEGAAFTPQLPSMTPDGSLASTAAPDFSGAAKATTPVGDMIGTSDVATTGATGAATPVSSAASDATGIDYNIVDSTKPATTGVKLGTDATKGGILSGKELPTPPLTATQKEPTFGKELTDILKKAGPQLGLGLLAKGMQPKLPQAAPAISAIGRNAATTQELGTDLLQKAQSGQVTASQQAGIDQWATQAKMKIKDYYAKAGIGDSSMAASAMAEIDQQAMAYKQQIIQDNLKQGMSALGASDVGSAQVANARLQQDQATQQALARFAQSIGGALGSTPTAAPAAGA